MPVRPLAMVVRHGSLTKDVATRLHSEKCFREFIGI